MNLFLDDIRIPRMSHNETKGLGDQFSNSDDWVIVRDYFQFKDFVDSNIKDIKLVSFDHDLACEVDGVEWTGKSAADYLIEKCLDNDISFPDFYVHSDNTSGRENIIGVILNFLKYKEGFDTSSFRYYHRGVINGKPV